MNALLITEICGPAETWVVANRASRRLTDADRAQSTRKGVNRGMEPLEGASATNDKGRSA